MDIILGLPGEGEAEVKKTIDDIVKLNPDSLTVHSLAVKRGSRMHERIIEKGYEPMVNTDGTISDVELFKSSGYKEFDDEAIRIVKSFPKWVPAKQDCQEIPFKTVVTIPFDAAKAQN